MPRRNPFRDELLLKQRLTERKYKIDWASAMTIVLIVVAAAIIIGEIIW